MLQTFNLLRRLNRIMSSGFKSSRKLRHSQTVKNDPSCPLILRLMTLDFLIEISKLLTCVGRVGRGAVEEAGGPWYAQVGHPRRPVSVHGGRDGVVVGLLGRGARHVATRRHAVWVTRVTWGEERRWRQKDLGSAPCVCTPTVSWARRLEPNL